MAAAAAETQSRTVGLSRLSNVGGASCDPAVGRRAGEGERHGHRCRPEAHAHAHGVLVDVVEGLRHLVV